MAFCNFTGDLFLCVCVLVCMCAWDGVRADVCVWLAILMDLSDFLTNSIKTFLEHKRFMTLKHNRRDVC